MITTVKKLEESQEKYSIINFLVWKKIVDDPEFSDSDKRSIIQFMINGYINHRGLHVKGDEKLNKIFTETVNEMDGKRLDWKDVLTEDDIKYFLSKCKRNCSQQETLLYGCGESIEDNSGYLGESYKYALVFLVERY